MSDNRHVRFGYPPAVFSKESMLMLSDDDRDYADLLFIRTRSGNPEQQSQAWQSLREWANSTERHAYLQRLTRADSALDQVACTSATNRTTPITVARRPARWLPIACAASLLLLVGGLYWLNPELSSERYTAQVGEHQEVHLSDGSRVVLNTDSEVRFTNRLRSREVELARGEGLFDVTASKIRPFYVHANDSRVRVVGTVFSVRELDAGSRIAVAHGVVEVKAEGEPEALQLLAGQQLETSKGRYLDGIRTIDIATVGSWSEGRLVFNQTPLREALAELQRYRKAPLLLDKHVGEQTLTGSFSSAKPDQLLELLPSIFPVRVVIAADGTAHVTAR